jgi:hypothetical protein
MKLSEIYPDPDEREKYLWEMASISPKKTGIKRVIIWASQAQDGAMRHGPRVKVSAHYTEKLNTDDLFVLTIQDNPQIVAGECYLSSDTEEDVKTWVSNNKELLLKYWRGEILTDEFLDIVEKI